ncbi:MAG TPA: ATP-binding protein, partial [Microvirga sp.]|nr:ATP-binding protein [Microvirga sp.]
SPGRARRLVAYLETRSIVVTRADPRGLRIIALPDLGWETAPGDPNAFEELQGPSDKTDLFVVG